jgi:DNA-directed RNA polymerase subunit beta
MEYQAARDSGQVVIAKKDGVIASLSNRQIVIREDDGTDRTYPLIKFMRSNQDTCINQRPCVFRGERVKANQVIADSSSTDNGELALGQNVLVAFMPWEGGNYEDAILVLRAAGARDIFTSIHIEKYEVEARKPKLATRKSPVIFRTSARTRCAT